MGTRELKQMRSIAVQKSGLHWLVACQGRKRLQRGTCLRGSSLQLVQGAKAPRLRTRRLQLHGLQTHELDGDEPRLPEDGACELRTLPSGILRLLLRAAVL